MEDGRTSSGAGLLGLGTTYSTQTSYKEVQWVTQGDMVLSV